MKTDDRKRRFTYEPGDVIWHDKNGQPMEMPLKLPGYEKLQIWRDGKLMDAPEEVIQRAERERADYDAAH